MTNIQKIARVLEVAARLGLDNALGNVTPMDGIRSFAVVHGGPDILCDLLGRPDEVGVYGCGTPYVKWLRHDEGIEFTTNGPEWAYLLAAPSAADLGKGE